LGSVPGKKRKKQQMATNRKNNNALNWANALDQITRDQLTAVQPSGSGWQTFTEILEMVEFGQCKLRKQIKAGIKSGKVLIFQGQEIGIDGQRRKKVWYKLKNK
jgi:hypothetical protein